MTLLHKKEKIPASLCPKKMSFLENLTRKPETKNALAASYMTGTTKTLIPV